MVGLVAGVGWFWLVLLVVLGDFGWFSVVLGSFGWFWLVPCFSNYAQLNAVHDEDEYKWYEFPCFPRNLYLRDSLIHGVLLRRDVHSWFHPPKISRITQQLVDRNMRWFSMGNSRV